MSARTELQTLLAPAMTAAGADLEPYGTRVDPPSRTTCLLRQREVRRSIAPGLRTYAFDLTILAAATDGPAAEDELEAALEDVWGALEGQSPAGVLWDRAQRATWGQDVPAYLIPLTVTVTVTAA